MEHKREWKQYQHKFRQIEYEKAKKDYGLALKSFAENGDRVKCETLAQEIKSLENAFDNKGYEKAVIEFKKAQKRYDEVDRKLRTAKARFEEAMYNLHQTKNADKSGRKLSHSIVEDMKKDVSALETEMEKVTAILKQKEGKMASFTNQINIKKAEIAGMRNKYRLDWYESRLPEIRPGILDRLKNFIFVDFLHPTDRINQVYLSGLANRVDRCTTCHMAIDRPGFEEVPSVDVKKTRRLGFKNKGLPFTTHSDFDIIIKNHPPERFGCTICHQGQGRATEGKSARGDVLHWGEPILPNKYIESSCAKCHF
ncbi:MAG: hypothetical protein AAB267_03625, partial [Candidatus Desantisbacteria bacterium]